MNTNIVNLSALLIQKWVSSNLYMYIWNILHGVTQFVVGFVLNSYGDTPMEGVLRGDYVDFIIECCRCEFKAGSSF